MKNKKHDKAVKDAYNMLVVFKRIVEDNPSLRTYKPEEIEEICKTLWSETLNEKPPWNN